MTKYIFSLLIILGLFSCKKKQDTSLKVTAYGITTNAPLQNHHLYVFQRHYPIPTNDAGDYTIITEGYTDANGQKDFGEFDCYKSDKYSYGVFDFDLGSSFNSNTSNHWMDGKGIYKGQTNNITVSY